MEELEDDEGNVYNRKTYDDLKKQGLIWCITAVVVMLDLTVIAWAGVCV